MGLFQSLLHWSGYKEAKVAIIGLDNSGKTTLLYMLQDAKLTAQAPTSRPNYGEIKIGWATLKAHDLGGHKSARKVWKDYFHGAGAIVFVVDCADRERFGEARDELQALLQTSELDKVPLLVLANKIDKKGAASDVEMCQQLGIADLCVGKGTAVKALNGRRPLELFASSTVKRYGYPNAFRWLAQFV